MTKTKKIEISITKEKLELLKKIGLSPEDVFFQGFEMLIKRKYKELIMINDDDDEEIDLIDINEITHQIHNIEEFLISERNISNN